MRILLIGVGVAVCVALAVLASREQLPRADFAFVNGTDPASLDPAKVTGVPEGRILRAILEGLTVSDPLTLEPRPGMAETWEVSSDGLTYEFKIRADARWSNGDPVTAHDFVWSWRRLLDPRTGGRYANLLWDVIGGRQFHAGQEVSDLGLRAVHDRRFEVRLERPVPHFLWLTSFYPLYPLHRASVEKAEQERVSFTRPGTMVTNGPFLLSERHLRDRIRMRRNPLYWGRENVRLETIDALAVESDNTALNLFLSGDVDWIVRVPRALVPILASDPRFADVYRPAPYFGTYFIRCNVTRPPGNDPAVRRILSLAIDRGEIVDHVTRAGEEPAWSLVPWPEPALALYREKQRRSGARGPATPTPVAWYERAYVADRKVSAGHPWETLDYDPDEARRRLRAMGFRVPRFATREDGTIQESGFTEGETFPTIEYLYNSAPLNERIGEILQAQWRRELGIEVRLANQEWGSYLSSTNGLDYDFARSAWIGDYLDPATFLEVFLSDGPNNRTGWKNAEYDARLREAASTVDREQRAALLHEAERILMRELPAIPLYYYVTDGMVSQDVGGFHANALDLHFPRFIYKNTSESSEPTGGGR